MVNMSHDTEIPYLVLSIHAPIISEDRFFVKRLKKKLSFESLKEEQFFKSNIQSYSQEQTKFCCGTEYSFLNRYNGLTSSANHASQFFLREFSRLPQFLEAILKY